MPEQDVAIKVESIRNYIKKLIDQSGMSRLELAKKMNMNTSRITALLDSNTLKLSDFYRFCSALDVTMEEVIRAAETVEEIDIYAYSEERFNRVKPEDRRWYHILESDSQIIYNPMEKEFRGLFGSYYFYCKPTDKAQLNQFQKGKFSVTFNADSLMRPYVGVKLEIINGPTYEGDLFYSRAKRSCIVILYAESVHDFCVMEFLYKPQEGGEKLMSRIMLCISSSANPTASKPVVSKAIISRKMLSDKNLNDIEGQFRLNTSTISVDADQYEKKIKNALPQNIQKLMEEKRYYTIKERTIFESRNTDDVKLKIRDILRSAAIEPYFIKIPYYIEERLEAYIKKLK